MTQQRTQGEMNSQELVDGRPQLHKLIRRIESNRNLLLEWRRGIARCSDEISHTVADIFNRWTYHGQCRKPLMDEAALKNVLQQIVPPPTRRSPFDRFAGKARGVNHFYDIATAQEIRKLTNFTYWDRATHREDDSWIQHITVSDSRYYAPASVPHPAQKKVDLIVNLCRPDLGITSWGSERRHVTGESAFICYEVAPEQALWFSKIVPDQGSSADHVFNISFEWWTPTGRQTRRYSMLAMSFDLDFGRRMISIRGNTCNEIRYEEHMPFPLGPEVITNAPSLPSIIGVGIPTMVRDLFAVAALPVSLPLMAASAFIESRRVRCPSDAEIRAWDAAPKHRE
jgi:hypothetical protein